MKYIIKAFFIMALLALTSCNITTSSSSTSASNPDFKIGKKGFEKELKKTLDFDILTIGTSITSKNGISEKGLTLTFKTKDLSNISDDIFRKYAKIIKIETEKYLLKKDTYDVVLIKFKEEIKGEILKSTSIEIKKELK
ncbi:hypothetical protein [uncultured Polaribacter sp.]|uniref:hypothetical protein n=1 Tax=uncultured Polaribacter sp. TaxID=174711 RepID=UPI002627F3D5|nr:hypothetical protein [uncultured Polaribacter sp.]